MDRDWIDEVVRKIMREDGPDRHVDGHEVLTDFIIAVRAGRAESWLASYERRLRERKEERQREDEEFRRLGLR